MAARPSVGNIAMSIYVLRELFRVPGDAKFGPFVAPEDNVSAVPPAAAVPLRLRSGAACGTPVVQFSSKQGDHPREKSRYSSWG